ncbi:hypothetical protein ACJMK2_043246 [Sinanodonta woodiana]|uniref:SRCR domain-containing protein n=1 Tax=Sinanodonta woodiana TaxID=1069815 RepID=A0ABD3VZ68_SINWO
MATITTDLVLLLTVLIATLSTSTTQNLVRLVGGKISSGIVEVTLNQTWVTLCGDVFSYAEAMVVCRELGYEQGLPLPAGSYGVLKTERYTTRVVGCAGSETSITSCRFSSDQCLSRGRQYAAVNCFHHTTADENSVRLSVNGSFHYGQVLVYMYGIWGQICDDFWDDSDAQVSCRQMGYMGGVATTVSYEETTPYVISKIDCFGNETNLGKCHQMLEVCGQNKSAAGIWCYISSAPRVSLLGGKAHYGTVLIQADNKSGTVCSTSWTVREATVVCRQLGFISGYVVSSTADSVNVPDVLITGVTCPGPRESIFRCYNASFNVTDPDCTDHKHDVRVSCFGSVRLAAGRETDDFIIGSVELYVDNMYVPVCPDVLTDNVAFLVCMDLRYNSSRILPPVGFGRYYSTYVTNVTCATTAKNISECSFATGRCARGQAASLVCLKPDVIYETKFLISNFKNGYVYIQQYGTNATICRHGWDNDDASVICKENGYKGGVVLSTPKSSSIYKQDPVWATDFRCTRDVARLSDCKYSTDVPSECLTDSTSAGVLCYTHYEVIQYRLADGKFQDAGRVEIYFDGLWGTICDNLWSRYDARVFCRTLGYADGNSHGSSFDRTTGTSPVYLSGLECDGTEGDILQCPNHGWMNIPTTCQDHTHDAGAVCYKYVKLHPSNFFGAVQFWSGGSYGLTCADNFDDNAATVTCRELGYDYGRSLCCSAAGPIDLPILLANVSCTGAESSLTKCSVNTSNPRCLSGTYATVVCTNFQGIFNGRVLINRGNFGQVQINYYGHQGYFCSEEFGDKEAAVICRQNGYLYGLAYKEITLDTRSIRWLRGLGCNGNETSIRQCANIRFGQIYPCAWDTVAAVFCTNDESQLKIDLRLTNGTDTVGRVEVFLGGQWGSICANSFTQNEAEVICRQLGYHGGDLVQPGYYGNGNGSFLLTSLRCPFRNETSIRDCYWKGFGEKNLCSSSAAAAVQCFTDGISVRLPLSSFYGPVEVSHYGLWGALCDVDFDDVNAGVVCRELGYQNGVKVSTITEPGFPVIHGSIRCIGSEKNLTQCQRGEFRVDHDCSGWNTVAGVICSSKESAVVHSNLSSDSSGLMQIHSGFDSLEIAAESVTDVEAAVYCKTLGFPSGRLQLFSSGSYDVTNVSCNGSETSFLQCKAYWDPRKAGTGTRAGVKCDKSVKLSTESGPTTNLGAVLLYYNGMWHTVCGDGFDDISAGVVCRELGYVDGRSQCCSTFGSLSYPHLRTGRVGCVGGEIYTISCLNMDKRCETDSYASVVCYYFLITTTESPREMKVKADPQTDLVPILIGVAVMLVLIVVVVVIVLIRMVKRRQSKANVPYNQSIVERSMDGSFSATNQLHGIVGTPDVQRATINYDLTVKYTQDIPDAYSNPGYETLPVITTASITQESGQVYNSVESITNSTARETDVNGHESQIITAVPTCHDDEIASDFFMRSIS